MNHRLPAAPNRRLPHGLGRWHRLPSTTRMRTTTSRRVAERRGGRVEPSFSPVERPRTAVPEPGVEVDEDDDSPPFALDDRLSDYDETELIAPPQPVAVAPTPACL